MYAKLCRNRLFASLALGYSREQYCFFLHCGSIGFCLGDWASIPLAMLIWFIAFANSKENEIHFAFNSASKIVHESFVLHVTMNTKCRFTFAKLCSCKVRNFCASARSRRAALYHSTKFLSNFVASYDQKPAPKVIDRRPASASGF